MTVPALVLYNAPTSGWGHRVSWLLEEVGADYKLETIDFAAKPNYYLTKVNPSGLVPVLQLGADLDTSVKIPESSVIIELIGDLYPASGVLPDTPVARAEGRYFAERFSQLIWSKAPALAIQGDAAGAPAFLKGVEELQGLLARHPGTFLLGDKLTLGDIAVGVFVGRVYAFAEAGLLDAGGVGEALLKDAKYAAFKKYEEAITSRPAFAKTFHKEKIVAGWTGRKAAFAAAAAK